MAYEPLKMPGPVRTLASAIALAILRALASAQLLEPAARVESEKELLPGDIDRERVVLLEVVLDGLYRAGPELLVDRVAVDVGVLDDQIAVRCHQRRVGAYLGQDV